ncbi:MAG: single-stranded DNA-binding protein [Kiritimatiellae bacterium]|nr:single-stranded DNA-binding protein [Kiritimatiellia bacterium]
MNSFQIIGNLTFDPGDSLQFTPNGNARCRFQIAINGRKKDSVTGEWVDAAEFPYFVCWGKQAENLAEYQKKGGKIGITGHVSAGSYEKEGEKKYYQDLVADRIEYLSPKGDSQNPSSSGAYSKPGASTTEEPPF